MVVKVFLVDALADGLFSGAKAGVVILRHLGQEVFLQALATELGLPVTVYVLPHQEAFMVRYFTPRLEVERADYAALASGQALFGAGLAPVTRPATLLGRGGRQEITRDPQDPDRLALTLQPLDPGAPGAPGAASAELLAAALGLSREDLAGSLAFGRSELALCCREIDLLHRAASALRAAGLPRPCSGLTLSAPLENGPGQAGYVVCSWNAEGEQHEAPVNLGVHAFLAPFWGQRLGGRQLTVHHLASRPCLMRADLLEGSQTVISGLMSTILKADPILPELTQGAALEPTSTPLR